MKTEEENIDEFMKNNFPPGKSGSNFKQFSTFYVSARNQYNNLLMKQADFPAERAQINLMTNNQQKQKALNSLSTKETNTEIELQKTKQQILEWQNKITPIKNYSETFKHMHEDTIIDTLIPVYFLDDEAPYRDLRRQLNLKIIEDGPVYKPLKENHYLAKHTYHQNPEYRRLKQASGKDPNKPVNKSSWSYKTKAQDYADTDKYSDVLKYIADEGYIYKGADGSRFYPTGGENATEIANNGKKRLISQILAKESQKEIEKRAGIKKIDYTELNQDGYIKHYLKEEDQNYANEIMAQYHIRRMKIRGRIYQPEDFN
jgi:hypothetical protein